MSEPDARIAELEAENAQLRAELERLRLRVYLAQEWAPGLRKAADFVDTSMAHVSTQLRHVADIIEQQARDREKP